MHQRLTIAKRLGSGRGGTGETPSHLAHNFWENARSLRAGSRCPPGVGVGHFLLEMLPMLRLKLFRSDRSQ